MDGVCVCFLATKAQPVLILASNVNIAWGLFQRLSARYLKNQPEEFLNAIRLNIVGVGLAQLVRGAPAWGMQSVGGLEFELRCSLLTTEPLYFWFSLTYLKIWKILAQLFIAALSLRHKLYHRLASVPGSKMRWLRVICLECVWTHLLRAQIWSYLHINNSSQKYKLKTHQVLESLTLKNLIGSSP